LLLSGCPVGAPGG
jgi:hypothetical protein